MLTRGAPTGVALDVAAVSISTEGRSVPGGGSAADRSRRACAGLLPPTGPSAAGRQSPRLGYAACVFGFGLVFRPLDNDEGVTLQVASSDSVRGVLDVAVNYRHGPPLHYLLVHASLALARRRVRAAPALGAARASSRSALAYGFGRELLGRAGGADRARWSSRRLADGRAPRASSRAATRRCSRPPSPACGCCWCCCAPGRPAGSRPGPSAALLLAGLPSVRAVRAVLGADPAGRAGLSGRCCATATGGRPPGAGRRPASRWCWGRPRCSALRHVYAPLQDKYDVGEGGSGGRPAVVERSGGELGEAWTGTRSGRSGSRRPRSSLAGVVVLARARPARRRGRGLAAAAADHASRS